MTRRVLTDDIWLQIEQTMKFYGCYRSKNSQNIMEAILWKLRTGATWRDITEVLCPWKTAYNRFNRCAMKGLWDKFFSTTRRIGYRIDIHQRKLHSHSSACKWS